MPEISLAAGQVVADDLRAAFTCLDNSLHTTARLVGTFLEASEGAQIAPVSTQKALRSMGDTFSKIIDGRGDMIAAQRHLVAIKNSSNLDVVDFGCLQQWASADQGIKQHAITNA